MLEGTPDQMVTKVRADTNQPDSTRSQLSDAEILEYLNEGLDEVVAETSDDPVSEDTTLTTTEGDFDYAKPTRFMLLRKAYIVNPYNSEKRQLRVLPSADMLDDLLRPTWRTDANGEPRFIAKKDNDEFIVAPAPNANWASKTIHLIYLSYHASMTAGGSAPTIAPILNAAIPDYASFRAWRKIGNKEKAAQCLADFRDKIKRFKMLAQSFGEEMRWQWVGTGLDGPDETFLRPEGL